jgi:hypothetical protein
VRRPPKCLVPDCPEHGTVCCVPGCGARRKRTDGRCDTDHSFWKRNGRDRTVEEIMRTRAHAFEREQEAAFIREIYRAAGGILKD